MLGHKSKYCSDTTEYRDKSHMAGKPIDLYHFLGWKMNFALGRWMSISAPILLYIEFIPYNSVNYWIPNIIDNDRKSIYEGRIIELTLSIVY